jgi:DNA helicase-4
MAFFSFWHSWRRSKAEKADRRKFAEGFTTWLPDPLTESQIDAAVSRAQETLVVAAAGSGKTTLLLGRAKYLIESGRAQPDRILALAFNRSAATELQERSEAVGVPMKAMTFHGFGNSLLNYEGRIGGVAFGDELSLDKFFAERVAAAINLDPRGKLAIFFSEMLVPVRDHSEFKTLADYAAYARAIPRTFSKHRVKSHGEFIIANYLFSRGTEFDYEAIYKGPKRTDWHRPDFTVHASNNTDVYIEYFGIDGQGNTAPYINREAYNREIGLKRQTHIANGTTLIELTYQDLKDGVLIEKLERSLNFLKIPASWKSGEELLSAANEVGYVNRFVRLCRSFLSHARARRLSAVNLSGMRIKDQRTRAFVDVFAGFLTDYENELAQLGLPDFSAMIHEAADQLIGGQVPFPFDHVLVDEFQDISADRQRLLEAMKVTNPEAEFFYVGDDWQSINRFAGADIGIMRRISRRARKRRTVRLAETHRFPQSLAEISGIFVQKNPTQLRKTIKSTNPSTSLNTLFIHTGADSMQRNENLKEAIESIGTGNDGTASLLVIARYNDNLPSRHDVGRLWNGRFDIRSIHRSKGSEADYVIVVDVVQDLRGFPSTIEDDPVLALVMPEPESYEYAEERRLFYVALTRARVACHLIAPLQQPSLFAVELLEQRHGVVAGPLNLETVRCPVCGSGVLATSSRDGGTHCSNSPYCIFRSPKCEICDQRLHATSLSPIHFGCINHSNKMFTPCPKCRWGILVDRRGRHGKFLGCSNYPVTGCTGKVSSGRRSRRF